MILHCIVLYNKKNVGLRADSGSKTKSELRGVYNLHTPFVLKLYSMIKMAFTQIFIVDQNTNILSIVLFFPFKKFIKKEAKPSNIDSIGGTKTILISILYMDSAQNYTCFNCSQKCGIPVYKYWYLNFIRQISLFFFNIFNFARIKIMLSSKKRFKVTSKNVKYFVYVLAFLTLKFK